MTKLRLFAWAAGCAFLAACGGDDDGGTLDGGGRTDGGRLDARMIDAPGLDAPATDAPATDAPATDAPGTDAPMVVDAGPPVGCSMGSETPIGRLCVTEATATTASFLVYPMGCYSSSCTIRHTTTCAANRTGSNITLDALFCLGSTGGPACTADCNGGGFAACDVALEAGSYTATLGALTLTFDAPSTIPSGGICVGSMF